jgi:hypothetical protein
MPKASEAASRGEEERHSQIKMDPSFRWDDEREGDEPQQELDTGSGEARPVLSLSKGRDDGDGEDAGMEGTRKQEAESSGRN